MSEPQISGHEETDPWAMNLVVDDSIEFSTAELMHAAALSVATFLVEPMDDETAAAVERWTSGRFRKILRRAKNSAFAKAASVPGKTFVVDGITLHVCTPFAVAETPKNVSRAQVSGLKVVDGDFFYPAEAPETGAMIVASNSKLSMSPGKEAVAVAHAAQLLLYSMDDAAQKAWVEAGSPIAVNRGLPDWITEEEAPVAIRDAGLTEVIPGSITAMGWIAA